MQPPGKRESRYFIATGVLTGAGIGLLLCDWIDLQGGDVNALRGWTWGVMVGAVLGGTIGLIRDHWHRDVSPSSEGKTLPIVWLTMGVMMLLQGTYAAWAPSANTALSTSYGNALVRAGGAFVLLSILAHVKGQQRRKARST